ncbi:hypothetical protein M3Y94_00401000 [Aphelenchoides besseyi]|nr:hypothetical protein M3Y94_00401000 [Aphelenchoides besseyi]KAI6218446.1 hypothetical protein M3Y95_01165100 [Aphelenchoides besseyi]
MTDSHARSQAHRSKRRLETNPVDNRRKIQNVGMSESETSTNYPSTSVEHNSTSNGAIIKSGLPSEQSSNDIPKPHNLLNQSADIQREIFSYLNIFDLLNLRKTCKQLRLSVYEEFTRRQKRLLDLKYHLKFELLKTDQANARTGHAMCYHEPDNRVYVCGGATSSGAIRHDVAYFDLETSTWNKLICSTQQRFEPSCCVLATLCSYKNSLYLFGGYKSSGPDIASISRLDLSDKSWKVQFCGFFKTVCGHTSIMSYRGQMITYGGTEFFGNPSQVMYNYDCERRVMSTVFQHGTLPANRVLCAMSFVGDSHLVVCGGQSALGGESTKFCDVHLFAFEDPDSKAAGSWIEIEVENHHLWPRCVPAVASNGSNMLFFVGTPVDTTHMLVDSTQFSQLNDDPRTLRFAEKIIETSNPISCEDLCMTSTLYKERTKTLLSPQRNSNLHLYPNDQLITESSKAKTARCQLMMTEEQQLDYKPFKNIAAVCRRIICKHYDDRMVKFYVDDFHYVLNWICGGRHSNLCKNEGLTASYVLNDACFQQNGCVWIGLSRHFNSENNEEFTTQLVAVVFNLCRLSGLEMLVCPFPILSECQFWRENKTRNKNLIPVTDFLKLHVLFPVHRTLIDLPLSCTTYKLDLSEVIETKKVRLHQDPPRFLAPTFHNFSVMTSIKSGFLLFGGSDRVVHNDRSSIRPHAYSDTIILS